MAEHNDFGTLAEKKAAAHLSRNNYDILEKNWHYKKAEIDIIALDLNKNQIVVVEVKARMFNSLINPREAVNQKKRKLLVAAANEYMTRNELSYEVRFDIITVIKSKNAGTESWEINH